MTNLGDVCKLASVLKRFPDGVLGAKPPAPAAMGVWGQSPQQLGDFCTFLEKKLFKSH